MCEAQLLGQCAHLLLVLGPPVTTTQWYSASCPQPPARPPGPLASPHSRVGVHEHHGQAADASGQEPLQLPTQTPEVHGLLHLQQVPRAACQEARHHPVRGLGGLLLPPPDTGGVAPLTGVPAPSSPRYSTTRSSTSSTSSYRTSGMRTAWGRAEAQRKPRPEGLAGVLRGWAARARGCVPTGQPTGPGDAVRQGGPSKAHPGGGSLPGAPECSQLPHPHKGSSLWESSRGGGGRGVGGSAAEGGGSYPSPRAVRLGSRHTQNPGQGMVADRNRTTCEYSAGLGDTAPARTAGASLLSACQRVALGRH